MFEKHYYGDCLNSSQILNIVHLLYTNEEQPVKLALVSTKTSIYLLRFYTKLSRGHLIYILVFLTFGPGKSPVWKLVCVPLSGLLIFVLFTVLTPVLPRFLEENTTCTETSLRNSYLDSGKKSIHIPAYICTLKVWSNWYCH